MLAGRLAGVLFLTAGLSSCLLLLVPGVEDRHWPWVLGLAGGCVGWALYCLTLARPEQHGPWFWHVPAALSIPLIAGLVASTGVPLAGALHGVLPALLRVLLLPAPLGPALRVGLHG